MIFRIGRGAGAPKKILREAAGGWGAKILGPPLSHEVSALMHAARIYGAYYTLLYLFSISIVKGDRHAPNKIII